MKSFFVYCLFALLPVGAPAQTIETDRIPGGMRGPYCLNVHQGGDLDFGGTPEFTAVVYVQVSADRKRVELVSSLRGYEPRNDQSWGTGVGIEYLWQAPPGATFRKLVKVYSDGNRQQGNKFYLEWRNYTVTGQAENQMTKPPLAVKRFYIVADVPGPDITPGDNPDCSQKANARFELYDYEVEYEMPAAAPAPPPPAKKQSASSGSTTPPQKASPTAVATGSINKKTVVLNYGQPSVRGRDAWTALSPYGKIWRTGANNATTIRFSRDVLVEGKPIPAGTYAFFTIPGPDRWTLIFNRTADQWGTYDYNPAEDVVRALVNSHPHDFTEQLTFNVLSSGVQLLWADKEVFFRVD
ncbi:MAG: DUF2911 domain-containing protein [Spirosoma sp.]|nr:DUF2911 domain-containing protein [Spirosoma sp.]